MEVKVDKLVYGGAGLARTDIGVVFVPKTSPGDVVEVEITNRKKDYATGRVVRIVSPSADRQGPFCPNYETVGCCHWQHIRYDRQLAYKEDILRETLIRLGHIPFDGPIQRISGPDRGYRLRASFHIRASKLAFVRENSNVIVAISECASLAPELNAFIPAANAVLKDPNFESVEEAHVIAGPGLALTLHFPDDRAQHPWERMRDAAFEIPHLAALTIGAGNRRLHYEKHPAEIQLRDFKYVISSDAFFQANRFLLDAFIDEVLLQAAPSGSNVLELFSGSGFFSIPLARNAGQLIGIDSNRTAVRHARDNAKLNAVSNAEFVFGHTEELLANAETRPAVVVLNPPRVGAGAKVAAQVAALAAERVVYVSCNPATFAREAAVLVNSGYKLQRLTLIDQFPHTYHIEFIAQFTLK